MTAATIVIVPVQIACRQRMRGHSRDEVHARFHHRRGVQIGADRRGRLHRVRQPEVERELGGLRECREQKQGNDPEVRRMIRERSASRHSDSSGVPACYQKQTRREQCEAPAACDEQCLSGRASSLRSFVVEPDQQVRREPGELPEHEQRDDVVAEDETEHRAHEREERDVEPCPPADDARGISAA